MVLFANENPLPSVTTRHDMINRSLINKTQETSHARSSIASTPKREQCYHARTDPAAAAKWTRGASNAGYRYLGCAKTFALMGKHFAEANLAMMKGRNSP